VRFGKSAIGSNVLLGGQRRTNPAGKRCAGGIAHILWWLFLAFALGVIAVAIYAGLGRGRMAVSALRDGDRSSVAVCRWA
jgi:hypothetical protein